MKIEVSMSYGVESRMRDHVYYTDLYLKLKESIVDVFFLQSLFEYSDLKDFLEGGWAYVPYDLSHCVLGMAPESYHDTFRVELSNTFDMVSRNHKDFDYNTWVTFCFTMTVDSLNHHGVFFD